MQRICGVVQRFCDESMFGKSLPLCLRLHWSKTICFFSLHGCAYTSLGSLTDSFFPNLDLKANGVFTSDGVDFTQIVASNTQHTPIIWYLRDRRRFEEAWCWQLKGCIWYNLLTLFNLYLIIKQRLLLPAHRRGNFAEKSLCFLVFNPQSFLKWENVSFRNFANKYL